MNQEAKQAIIVSEAPGEAAANDNDSAILAGAVAGFVKQQQQALPDYKETSEKSLTANALDMRQIEATATMGGSPTRSTTFLASAGGKLAVVQVISNAKDTAGHSARVAQVMNSMQGKQ